MNTTPQALHLEELTMTYTPGQHALHNVNVTVQPGSVLAVLGPSGSGKSTLLNLVAGLQAPSAGSIRVGERVLSTPAHQVRPEARDISMVFQDYALWPHMTVHNIIGYGLRYGTHKLPAKQRDARVNELLDMLQLGELAQRRPAELSGGQQQRVSIARALATRPALLLFDEPLSNLDTQLRQEMRDELGRLFQQVDTTALYVTHDFQEALALADNILILEHGRTVQIGSPHQVYTHPANPWAANLAGFSVLLEPHRVRRHLDDVEMQFGTTWLPAVAAGAGWETPAERGFQVAIHPEGIHLTNKGQLAGTITTSTYEGNRWRLRINVAHAGVLTAYATKHMQPGLPVRVAIDAEATRLFHPAPASGHHLALTQPAAETALSHV